MIKSPKEKFQSSQVKTGQWEQIVANPLFSEAIDCSLLQLLGTMPEDAASHYQMMGAQKFVRILQTIHETTKEPKTIIPQSLNYQAGV